MSTGIFGALAFAGGFVLSLDRLTALTSFLGAGAITEGTTMMVGRAKDFSALAREVLRFGFFFAKTLASVTDRHNAAVTRREMY